MARRGRIKACAAKNMPAASDGGNSRLDWVSVVTDMNRNLLPKVAPEAGRLAPVWLGVEKRTIPREVCCQVINAGRHRMAEHIAQ